MNNYVYFIDKTIYINLTNRCSNNCDFCIRRENDGMEGTPLWIEEEPTAEDIIDQLPLNMDDYDEEVVFCGFGEPSYNLEALADVASYLRCIDKKTRVNTNGQALLIAGEEAISLFCDSCDTINVSLNAPSATKYDALCHSEFGSGAFESMMTFVKRCKNRTNVILSVVDCIPVGDIELCKQLASELNVPLRIREKE